MSKNCCIFVIGKEITIMEINITVRKDRYGSKFAFAGDHELFQFEERTHNGAQWYFWPAGNYNPTVFNGKEFPMNYFVDACKAKYMLDMKETSLPEKVNVVGGKSRLDWMG